MLAAVRDKVAALKAAGASEEEAIAKKPTAEFDAGLGQGLYEATICLPASSIGRCRRHGGYA